MVVIDDEYEEIIENIETLIDDASDEVLASIRDDTKFPVVEDGKNVKDDFGIYQMFYSLSNQ